MNSPEDFKEQVIQVFNTVAPGYDDPALRHFPFCADRMLSLLQPRPGAKVLDVATGTGALALAAARLVGPAGRVTGIDLAESMLAQAQAHAERQNLNNVDWHVMDAEDLEFRSAYFDVVACAFGLFFLSDLEAAVRGWLRVLKPGGRLAFATFDESAFQPMSERFLRRIADQTGLAVDGSPLQRLNQAGKCQAVLEASGAVDVQVHTYQLGHHLQSAEEWWSVLWNSGYRGYLERLSAAQLADFKPQHLAEVDELGGERGIWMDVTVHIAQGRRKLDN